MQAAANGLTVHHSVSPATLKTFKEASKLAAYTPTPTSSSEAKKVWDKFVNYTQHRGFNPLEATPDDVQTWIIQRSQDTAAPVQVQFELQAIKMWRLNAGKPLGYIPFETSVGKGLLNYVDPSHSGIKGFEPYQLHVLIKKQLFKKKVTTWHL